MGVVKEWEEAVRAAEAHWEAHGDLDSRSELCEGEGQCMECQYDGCERDECDLYRRLTDRVRVTHAAVVEAARSQDQHLGEQK